MQQIELVRQPGKTEQGAVDAGIESLPTTHNRHEHLAEIAHDARNMVTALDLYCDLLQEPGVLASPFSHYGDELRLVAAASRALIGKLSSLEPIRDQTRANPVQVWKSVPAEPIVNLAQDLPANQSLLAVLAGPGVNLTMSIQGGAVPVRMSPEDLTRILVNLVKNAAEAMRTGGRIHITLQDSLGWPGNSPWVTLNVEDNGPGLPDRVVQSIFDRQQGQPDTSDWPVGHRGLGLPIIRSLVEAAGGMIHAANRDPAGTCFQIELPAVFS